MQSRRSGLEVSTLDTWKRMGKAGGRGRTVDEEKECRFLGMVICVGNISRGLESQNCVFRESNLD